MEKTKVELSLIQIWINILRLVLYLQDEKILFQSFRSAENAWLNISLEISRSAEISKLHKIQQSHRSKQQIFKISLLPPIKMSHTFLLLFLTVSRRKENYSPTIFKTAMFEKIEPPSKLQT